MKKMTIYFLIILGGISCKREGKRINPNEIPRDITLGGTVFDGIRNVTIEESVRFSQEKILYRLRTTFGCQEIDYTAEGLWKKIDNGRYAIRTLSCDMNMIVGKKVINTPPENCYTVIINTNRHMEIESIELNGKSTNQRHEETRHDISNISKRDENKMCALADFTSSASQEKD
jgi:hypothetical protein